MVVVPVDPFDDRDLEFAACSPWPVEGDELGFERAVQRFGNRAVIGVADRADRGEPCFAEQPERWRAVLALPGEIAPIEPIEFPCRAQVDAMVRPMPFR